MAGKLPLRLTTIASQRSISCLAVSRSTTTALALTLRSRPSNLISKQSALFPRPTFQQSFRRSFADQAPKVELSPQPKPKKRFRFFRFLWRVTYLSSAAFFGWIGYSIWQLRNPAEQFEPDPNKKTLVVLGA
jgi:NADH:ubiquinone reductase (non-electrogenic)